MRRTLPILACLLILPGAAVGWQVRSHLLGSDGPERDGAAARPVPVEVAEVVRGPIERRRVFSGTLESTAEFRVAPKVGGRVERLTVDLADEVENGAVVATLDSAEYEQAVAQAEADLAVVEANLTEARSRREIADRAMQRQSTLRERGVASDVQFDDARADQLAAAAGVAVAEARRQRAVSALESARIRLGYTKVRATWSEGDPRRVVSERTVEEGDTVAANTALLSIVELDPIQAVVYVAERDYALLRPGQPVTLRTDAWPGRSFTGAIARVAPVFQSSSRQARVELSVPNPERILKPGMFVRAEAVLERVDDATVVPGAAIVRRGERPVVFVIDEAALTARLRPVEVGIDDAGRVQVTGVEPGARVVTLGQQLLDDGSAVRLPDAAGASDP